MLNQLARSVPPVGRLYDRIDVLAGRVDGLQAEVAILRGQLASVEHDANVRHEAMSALLDAQQATMASLGERLAALDAAVGSLTGQQAAASGEVSKVVQATSALERDVDRLHRRVVRGERLRDAGAPGAEAAGVAREPSAGGAPPVTGPTLSPELYVALEDRFRGDPVDIAARQAVYLRFLEGCDGAHPVLDLGPGRGEWLEILRRAGIPAYGVDANPAMVAEATADGLDIRLGDALDHLMRLPDASLAALTLFQVVEHLEFPLLVDLLAAATRVLVPGGVLMAETPNALNVTVAASSFWIDPTHQRPLHPDLLTFLAREAGFARTEQLFLHPPRPDAVFTAEADDQRERVLADMERSLFGPQDFTLVAWTPTDEGDQDRGSPAPGQSP